MEKGRNGVEIQQAKIENYNLKEIALLHKVKLLYFD